DPKNSQEVNYDLPENPTPLQVAKFEICQEILGYKLKNNLTRQQVAAKMDLSKAETEDVLFCCIEKFTLDSKVDNEWQWTYELKIIFNYQEIIAATITSYYQTKPGRNQKGGVGKSTLARALAVEATRAGLKTLLADCDPGQETSYKWSKRREREPKITVQVFSDFATAYQTSQKGKYDLLIIDGPAMISAMTKEIAKQADYIIQPVKPYLDDLEPAVKDKLLLALNQVLNTNSEKDARDYLATTPYKVLKNSLPERQAPTMGSDNLKKGEVSRKDSLPTEPKPTTKKNNSVVATKRTQPLTTKLTSNSYDLLVKIAYQKRRKIVEVLEEGIELVGEKEKIRL
ncbi:5381_t:CDS:2, partial [Cetraspora pellucida]